MAYNPFDFFRRNQKLFFGGLTVLVMFMFILSFGQGDFFSRFPEWIRKYQTTGDVMAKVEGATIKESQLRDVGQVRGLANGYMLAANAKSLDATAKKAQKEASAATTKELREQLDQDVGLIDNRLLPRRLPVEVWPLFRAEIARLAGDLRALQESTPKSDDKQRVQAVRVYADAAVNDLTRRMSGDRGENGVYFANQPNRNDRDRLEFLLWKKKADQLGIRYTQEDVIKLVDGEFPSDSIPADDLKAMAIESAARQNKRPPELYEALADEFRVRAVQTAVMGVNAVRFPAAPPVGTARERYEHFVSETTATKYTLLTIPVEAYLAEVDRKIAAKELAGPTEAELTKIFNEASKTDPDPASPRGGVREPRKVSVQWIEVSGEEEYYKTLAAKRGTEFQQIKGSLAAQAVFGGTVPPSKSEAGYDKYLAGQAQVAAYRQTKAANPGRPALGNDLLTAVGGGLMADPQSNYSGPQALSPLPNPADRQDGLTDAELFRPDLAAVFAGLTASSLATNGVSFATPAVAVTEAAYRQTREQRAVAGIQAFHFPTLGGASVLADAVGGAVAMTAANPAALPEAAVQPLLARRTAETLQTEVATEDLQAFQKELARILGQKLEGAKPADKAAQEKAEREYKVKLVADAKKYTDEWIAARKLKTGSTTEPRSVHTLADDPGLAPLLQKDIILTDAGGRPRNARAATSFGQAFVNETDLTQSPEGGLQPRLRPATGLYLPRNYDPIFGRQVFRQAAGQDYAPFGFMGQLSVSRGGPLTAFWRTAEVDPLTPLSLSGAGVRDKCVAIWKLNKARELARQAADKAAETIRKDGTSEVQLGQGATQAIDDLKKPFDPKTPAYARFQVYYQEPQFTVAKLLVGPDQGPGTPPELVPFNPTHRSMVYETDKLREELIAKKDAPLGTTFVVTDQPQTTLYLLVVAGRDQKGDHLFRDHVLYPSSRPPVDAPVLSAETLAPRLSTFTAEAERKAAVALLKAEFKYTDENPKLDEKKD